MLRGHAVWEVRLSERRDRCRDGGLLAGVEVVM